MIQEKGKRSTHHDKGASGDPYPHLADVDPQPWEGISSKKWFRYYNGSRSRSGHCGVVFGCLRVRCGELAVVPPGVVDYSR